ncbi:MAG: AAA family ATPase [Caldilineaceae bacterium]
MTNKLHLHLFGSPQFVWQDKALNGFVSNKARALLIYLAVTGRSHSRDTLAELLWADTPITRRANLRRVLSNLRGLEGMVLLEEGQQLVGLDRQHLWVDVVEFTQVATDTATNDMASLQHAVQLYQGEFLTGFPISISYEFEAWVLAEQARLKEQLVTLLRRLADEYASRDDLPQAIAMMRRLLQLEPWQEGAHRQLIELLARNGEGSAALAHFEECRIKLRAELDVEPAAATLELVAQIRAGAFRHQRQQHLTAALLAPPSSPQTARSSPDKQVATKVEYPLVGRAREWQRLRTIWQALDSTHFVLIGGEAGIGKTRLAEELLLLAEATGAAVARTRSHALQGRLAYGPIADWLRSAPLHAVVPQLAAVWITEIARLLPELLTAGVAPPEPMNESWQRTRFFDALVTPFTAVDHPLLLVLDDLQWSDAETLAWLQYLVERSDAKILVVGTVRNDEIDATHPLHQLCEQLHRYDQVTELQLSPLDAEATAELAAQVANRGLTARWAERIFQDTAGNPLFVIESMRAMLANGQPMAGMSLPPSVATDGMAGQYGELPALSPKMRSVIRSRVVQLSPEAQLLAQVGATIGRAFDSKLLARAAEMSEDAAFLALDELWRRRIIREVDATQFDFSHDRIRDVVYAEISPIKRKFFHHRVIEALLMIHPTALDRMSGELARHYEQVGEIAVAVEYYQRAANIAHMLHAYREKIKYLDKAIALLKQLPDRTDIVDQELSMLREISKAYYAIDGFSSFGVEWVSRQMLALAETTKHVEARYEAATGLRTIYQSRGELREARKYAIECLELAQKLGGHDRIGNAHNLLAASYFHMGDLSAAWPHFKEALSVRYPNALIRSTHTAWLLGYADQAIWCVTEAIQTARERSDPYALGWALTFACQIDFLSRNFAAMNERQHELQTLATKYDLAYPRANRLFFQGWFLATQGDIEQALTVFQEGVKAQAEIHNKLFQPLRNCIVVDGLLRAKQFAKAMSVLEYTIADAQRVEEIFLNAELFRLKGDILLQENNLEAEATTQYWLAIETAQAQDAKSLELRATISLCRLWQQQGKIAEAHQRLAAIYSWFTEGFATHDLMQAKALLAELKGD